MLTKLAPAGRFRGALLAALCWIACAGAAEAQPDAPRPPTREEVERPLRPPAREPGARLAVDSEIERAPCALDDPRFQGIRFTPRAVLFEDIRGRAPEVLRPAYAPFLGQEQPISVLCEIRDRAAAILREAGYVAAVEVPVQRIEDGIVRFQVLMARLVAIRVRGDAGRAERTIAGYLERLTGLEVFNRFEAERYLLLASDLPGYYVRLALRSAGSARGDVIGEVTVLRTPALADFTVQNFGSEQLGPWGGLLRGQLYGVTGLGDRTTLALFAAPDFDEQRTVQLGHDFRLGSEGLGLSGQFTYAWARPELGEPGIAIDARTLLATAEANFPFVRRQARTIRAAIGLDFIDQEVDFNDLPLSRERLSVGFARLDLEAQSIGGRGLYTPEEPRWRFAASAQLRRGLAIFGASESCAADPAGCASAGAVPPSRIEGDPTATVLRGEAIGEFRPLPGLTLAIGAAAQHSGQPLFAFEEFSAGNYTVGRGYDPGILLGDSGIGFQAELRFGRALPETEDGWALQPYLFYDRAWVWNKDRLVILASRNRLASLGGGVRAAWADKARLDLVLAIPRDRAGLQTERPDPRLLLTFTTRFWPWSFR